MSLNQHYTTIRIEGGLFSPDLLDALTSGELPGQKPGDFGLPTTRNLTNEIAAIFSSARALWQTFQHRLERLAEGDVATSLTRDAWAIPFLKLLGYELQYSPRAYVIDGMTFAISHRAGTSENAPPVHIVGARQELGRVAASGRPRLSPHALVQEFLNRSEALWGIVTNGITLRLLRNSTYIRRQAYVEFDLQTMLSEDRFPDFALLYRLLHRTRLPQDSTSPETCLLEQYYRHSLEQGGRVREHLREGVEQCLKMLANGFLQHPSNKELRERITSEDSPSSQMSTRRLTPYDFYQQLLRLVYRLLFLLVAEERGLMGTNALYLEHYGVSRLRRLAERRTAYTDEEDLWHELRVLWRALADEHLAPLLGIPPLNGELFAPLDLDACSLTNRDLLSAFWYLAFYRESEGQPPRRVNYAALDTEELGSVYESLLDYHPVVERNNTGWQFDLIPGSQRKSTGSYYTPPDLVNELIQSTLQPVIEERLKKATSAEEKERALLSIRVLDPSAGSGHFLLAAARRLGKELARVRTGEEEPAPERVREAIRDVVRHCIYGVDKNPLAVELCRVALWIESHAEGKPLTFLDHHIRCGDSLVGVLDLETLKAGIPDEAFEPLTGNDKKTAASLKRQNRTEREGQFSLFQWNLQPNLQELADLGESLVEIPDDSPEQVRRKQALYEARWNDPQWSKQKEACDLWTAAFFQRYTPNSPTGWITSDVVRRCLEGQPLSLQTLVQATALAQENRFFHWPLEFPEVFAQGGFDVILGNPPFSAKLTQAVMNYVKTVYDESGSTNTASLFWFRTSRLTKVGGKIGLVTPKSIIYSTRWTKTRSTLSPYLEELIDCGEAWKSVLLEQVLVVVTKDKLTRDVKTKRLYFGTHKSTYISRQMLNTLDVWLISPESGLVEILQRVQSSPQEWLPLGKVIKTYRGEDFSELSRTMGIFLLLAEKILRHMQ